jgi:hypothetical protein
MATLSGASATVPMRSPALQSAMDRARQQAGRAPLTTGHLLVAMVFDTDSQASRALGALGVTGEAVVPAVAGVPAAGTSDATPSPQSVSISAGETTLLLTDADLAAALQALTADELRDAFRRAMGLTEPDQATGPD